MQELSRAPKLTLLKILGLWMPLALMWVLLTVEPPIVDVGIARLPEVKLNLAAFGLAFSIALILQSPVLQLLSTVTALADGRRSYRRILMFAHIMVGSLTALHLLVGLTPVYGLLARKVLGVPVEIAIISRPAFMILTPLAGSIAYRRVYQGLLIRYERNAVVPYTTATRLVVALLILFLGASGAVFSGAIVGAFAIIMGSLSAAATAFLFALPVLRKDIQTTEGSPIAWRDLLSFYLPLAMTTVLLLSLRAVMSAGLARTAEPRNALALWPVVYNALILFGSSAYAYQEVVITQLRGREERAALMRFAGLLALGLSAAFFLVATTPLRLVWLRDISRLPPDMLSAARVPLIILSPVPAMQAFLSVYRGELISSRHTRFITHGTAINFGIIGLLLLLVVPRIPVAGVTAASGAYIAALVSETLYLRYRSRQNARAADHL